MDGIASVLGVVLAATFVFAASLKLRQRSTTGDDFTSLGLPLPGVLAVGVPVAELGVAGALLVVPGWGATAGFALLAAFSTLLVGVIRSGRVVACACFGGNSSEPVDVGHLARNAMLMLWALPVLTIDRLYRPSIAEFVIGVGCIALPAMALHERRHSRHPG